jgi:hypothetical protein
MAIEYTSMEFAIPFLFMFAVTFGVLDFSNVLKNRAVHAVVAFALAGFAATETSIMSTITAFMPSAVWFFIILFFFAFISRLFGLRGDTNMDGRESEGTIVGAAVLFALMGVGWQVLDQFRIEIPFIGGGDNLLFLLGFLVVVSLFWGIIKTGHGIMPVVQAQKKQQQK